MVKNGLVARYYKTRHIYTEQPDLSIECVHTYVILTFVSGIEQRLKHVVAIVMYPNPNPTNTQFFWGCVQCLSTGGTYMYTCNTLYCDCFRRRVLIDG
jgi:hypothetical protein